MPVSLIKSSYRIWAIDDVIYGPVDLSILRGWVQEERITPQTWIFDQEKDCWYKAEMMPELQVCFQAKADPGATHSTMSDSAPLVPGIKPGMLRRVKIFAGMTDQELGRFVQFMEVLQIRQWTEIVKQGSHGDAMYLVLEGEVRVRMMIAGKETILVTLPAGEFFGEISLFDQGARSADVIANQNSVLLKISASAFQKLIQHVPAISAPFLLAVGKTLAARIRADDKRYRDSINFARAANASW
jgi:cAMP-binding proteins - catabolite gene activator and regulatory subunit of cAMP-dependent protein kinases